MFGAGFDYCNGLRMRIGIHKKHIGFTLFILAFAHGHSFGGGCAFVQHRSVGHFHAGQIDDHLLIIQQSLKAALGDFRLVGRVSCVPTRVFQHITQYNQWHMGIVIAHAYISLENLVFVGDFTQVGQSFRFSHCRIQIQLGFESNAVRYSFVDQLLDALQAQCLQHLSSLLLIRPNVAANKFIMKS